MKNTYVVIGVILLTATAALAHQGVKNKAVMARMNAMSEIAKNTKTLGEMAKGATTFDAEAAREQTQSLGLKTMIERIASIGGTLEYDSKVGEGTSLHIQVPCKKQP